MKSLKDFNPIVVAKLETEMWRAYYEHRFARLIYLMFRLLKSTYGFSLFEAIRMAYFAGRAAVIFRKQRDREAAHKQKIIGYLERGYQLLESTVAEAFDSGHVAELEYNWWVVDRYQSKYRQTRRDAIADTTSELFGISKEKVEEYAELRSSAMELQDVAEADGDMADWNEVEALLTKAYLILHQEVNQAQNNAT